MRLERYRYKGEMRHALPFKLDRKAPRIEVRDSVIAIEEDDIIGGKHTPLMWRSINTCSNNLLLWLPSKSLPSVLRSRPKCFRLLKGDAARKAWDSARRNWIDCHPEVARFSRDPRSRSSRCDRATFGGFR